MMVVLKKSRPSGKVAAPASKSLTIRAVFCAALAGGESIINNPLDSEDTRAAASVLGQLGAEIITGADAWKVRGGTLKAAEDKLFCGESAATLRFLTAVTATIPGRHRISGGPSLTRRPVRTLVEALRGLGTRIEAAAGGYPPVLVEGGSLEGGEAALPGDISSQYISGLLLAAPLTQNGLIIRLTTPPASRPYILLTVDMLHLFGIETKHDGDIFSVKKQSYRPAKVNIEGDWSSASYFVALGAVSSEKVSIGNLAADSRQGDSVIMDIARDMGAVVEKGAGYAAVARGRVCPFSANLKDCTDLLPTVAVMAALAEGTSEIKGIATARIKESDRVAAMRQGLEQLGVKVDEEPDSLRITGPVAGDGPVTIDSYDDHRIAMAFGVLGAVRGGIVIDRAECVAKTFPGYWDALKKLGVEMEIQE